MTNPRKPSGRKITDKERLDFLQAALLSGSYRHESIFVSRHLGHIKTVDGPQHSEGQRDLRVAIDVAIRASRKRGGR